MYGPQLIDLGNPVADHPLNTGLAAWWLPLPNRAGGGTLFDLAGRYPAALTNGPTWAAGANGFAAVSFDGVDDKVSLSGSLPTTNGYTVAAWCRPASTSGGAHNLFSGGQLNYGVQLRRDGSSWNLYHRWGADLNATYAGGVTAGRDTFVVGTWDGSGAIALYVDGVLRQQTTGVTALDNTPLVVNRLGCDDNDGGNIQFWDGLIWDVRWYAAGLSAAAVWGLYDQGRRGHPDTLRRYTPRLWLLPDPGGGAGAQTLTPAAGSATGGAADPTLTPGAVALTSAAGSAAAAGPAPALTPGSLSLTPAAGSGAGAGVNPTLTPGATSPAVSAGTAAGAAASPALTPGAVALAPAAGSAAGSGSAPTIGAGGALAAAAGSAAAAGVNPALTAGGVSLAPAAGSASGAGVSPAVLQGTVLAVSAGSAAGSGVSPTLTPGSRAITVPAGSAAGGGVNLTLSGGGEPGSPAGGVFASGVFRSRVFGLAV